MAFNLDFALRSVFFSKTIKTVLCVILLGLSLPTQAKSILVLGDSLSASYQIQLEKGWVYLLTDKLKASHPEIKVNNASFGGATTAAGVQRLPALLKEFNPDILILELGGNDGLQGKPVNYIKSNLSNIIETAQAAGVNVLLFGIKIPPNYGARYTEPFFNQYEELATQYNLLYVPFMLQGIIENSLLMQNDGIHPTAEAQPMILDNIWPTLAHALDLK